MNDVLPSNLIVRTVNARHRCTVTATPPLAVGSAWTSTLENCEVPKRLRIVSAVAPSESGCPTSSAISRWTSRWLTGPSVV